MTAIGREEMLTVKPAACRKSKVRRECIAPNSGSGCWRVSFVPGRDCVDWALGCRTGTDQPVSTVSILHLDLQESERRKPEPGVLHHPCVRPLICDMLQVLPSTFLPWLQVLYSKTLLEFSCRHIPKSGILWHIPQTYSWNGTTIPDNRYSSSLDFVDGKVKPSLISKIGSTNTFGLDDLVSNSVEVMTKMNICDTALRM